MALGMNKILISGTSANTPGAYLQYANVTVANTTAVLTAGTYIMFPTANVTVEAVSAYNATTSTATWSTWIANNTGGVVISDGVNVRLNAAFQTSNVTLLTVNGGQAVSGTFNS